MTIHLKYGGSTAARTMQCPAWHRLAEDVPREQDTSFADEGSLLHNCMEEIYDSDDIENPFEHASLMLKQGREFNGVHLEKDMVHEKLWPAITAVEKLIEDYDLEDWHCEPFVKMDSDMGGSIDMLGLSADFKTAVVADYKFGYNTVAVQGNKQARFYALCALIDDSTASWFDQVERIVLAIIQPNGDGDDLQIEEITLDDIDTFETSYLAAVEQSEEPTAQPKAGKECKYCPALAVCPVKTGEALQAARVSEIMADKLSEYLPIADQVIEWANKVKKMAHEQMELGVPVKGYKLVNKRATRVWTDKAAVEDKIRKAKKIKLEDGFDLKLKSPAQMEKKCKELGVKFEPYQEYISSVSSGTTLALESDKRPAALPVQGLEQLNEINK